MGNVQGNHGLRRHPGLPRIHHCVSTRIQKLIYAARVCELCYAFLDVEGSVAVVAPVFGFMFQGRYRSVSLVVATRAVLAANVMPQVLISASLPIIFVVT